MYLNLKRRLRIALITKITSHRVFSVSQKHALGFVDDLQSFGARDSLVGETGDL